MKCSIFLLLTLIFGLENVVGLKFVNPIVYEAQEKFKLSWDELKEKCDCKGPSLFSGISELRDQYDLKSAEVKTEILNKAKKSCDMTDEKWNQLINKKCYPNEILVSISQRAIDKIQLCLEEKDRLNEKQTKKAKQELLERFCSLIKMWSKFEYMTQVKCNQPDKAT